MDAMHARMRRVGGSVCAKANARDLPKHARIAGAPPSRSLANAETDRFGMFSVGTADLIETTIAEAVPPRVCQRTDPQHGTRAKSVGRFPELVGAVSTSGVIRQFSQRGGRSRVSHHWCCDGSKRCLLPPERLSASLVFDDGTARLGTPPRHRRGDKTIGRLQCARCAAGTVGRAAVRRGAASRLCDGYRLPVTGRGVAAFQAVQARQSEIIP